MRRVVSIGDQLAQAVAAMQADDLEDLYELAKAEMQSRAQEQLKLERLVKERLIGGGAYSSVWLVKDRSTGSKFALKQIRKSHVVALDAAYLLMREKQAYEELRHPNIIELCQTFQDETNLMLVLELAEGGDLYSLMEANPILPEAWGRFYLACVALALHHMHRTGYVYRDLKLENVLLDKRGYVKLADMGYAKKLSAGHGEGDRFEDNRTYSAYGTPEYAPPELLRGKGRSAACDWWALGILMHEVLLGRPPFRNLDEIDAFTRSQLRAEHSKFEQRFKAAIEKGVSTSAGTLICGLLQADEQLRLGCGPAGFKQIRTHSWFASLDWVALLRRQIEPPTTPAMHGGGRPMQTVELEPGVLRDQPFNAEKWAPIFEPFGPRVAGLDVSKDL